jgi:DNA-directed RNA polymerase specialized sigma24 family protein
VAVAKSRENKDWGDILRRILENDRVAFAELTRLITTQLRRCGAYDQKDDWDDLVQDVTMDVLKAYAAGGIRELKALPGFVHVVVRRKHAKRFDAVAKRGFEVTVDDPEAPLWLSVRGVSYEITAVRTEVEKLPESQRKVVIARAIIEMTWEEAAEAVGLPIGTVRNHYSLGLERLLRNLGPGDN